MSFARRVGNKTIYFFQILLSYLLCLLIPITCQKSTLPIPLPCQENTSGIKFTEFTFFHYGYYKQSTFKKQHHNIHILLSKYCILDKSGTCLQWAKTESLASILVFHCYKQKTITSGFVSLSVIVFMIMSRIFFMHSPYLS